MILADNKKFVVPTPTKTGTFSLESSLSRNGFGVIMPRHRRRIPDGWHGAEVVLMCRHPFARLVSMYRYGIVHGHSWLLTAAGGREAIAQSEAKSFTTFCQTWARYRDENQRALDWVSLYVDYVAASKETNKKVTVIKLEDDGVHGLLDHVGLGHLADKNINRSHDKFARPSWERMWTRKTVDIIGNRVDADLKLGNYKRPRP
jgi:hypothetical protein